MWGKLAEIAGQWLTKGQEVFIEGMIETRMYEGKDGNKRYITEIVADNMQMGAKPKGYADHGHSQPQPAQEEIPTINIEDEEQKPYPSKPPRKEEEEIILEDIPF
jgi:single-strand DNA-binding protein